MSVQTAGNSRVEEIDLDEDEDAALDRAWAKWDRQTKESAPVKMSSGFQSKPQAVMPESGWGQILTEDAPHVRIIGQTQSGKTTLAQALATQVTGRIVVLDPVWEPGNWGGLPAYTVSPDGSYEPIAEAIDGLLEEMKKRGSQLQEGKKDFERLTIIFDEVPDTVQELPMQAGMMIRRLAQRGRHGNMHLIGIGQSSRVSAWGIQGSGDTAENFATVYLGAKAVERDPRMAGEAHPAILEWRGVDYGVDTSDIMLLAQEPISQERVFKIPGVPSPTEQATKRKTNPDAEYHDKRDEDGKFKPAALSAGAEFKESDHKRDGDGKFTATGKRMYRGIGEGADTTSGFEWHSETPALAQKYADFRKGGKVEESVVSVDNYFDAKNPKSVLNANSFFADATKQAGDISKLDKSKVMEARRAFLAHFGKDSREITDYWANPEAKEATRDLLEALGFDAIHMVEGGEHTVASLRKKESPASLSAAAKPKKGKGQWITIGAKDGHGGSPVYVVNGRITKGAPSLSGKTISQVEDAPEGGKAKHKLEAGPVSTHAQELKASRDYEVAKARKTAKAEGMDPTHLDGLAADIQAHDGEFVKTRIEALKAAKTLSAKVGQNIDNLKKQHQKMGLDPASIKGFDLVARNVANSYPELFAGMDEQEAASHLFDMLTSPAQPKMTKVEAYHQALEHLRANPVQKYVPQDEVPFSAGAAEFYERLRAATEERRGPVAMSGWITLKPSGTHVYLDDKGHVAKGPSGMTGKHVSKLGEKAGPYEGPVQGEPHKAPEQPKHQPIQDEAPEGFHDEDPDEPEEQPTEPVKPDVAETISTNWKDKPSEEVQDKLKDLTNKTWKKLGGGEQDAIRDYTDDGYRDLNAAMRQCPPSYECVSGIHKLKMDAIESALAKAPPLPEPIDAYRGMSLDHGVALQMLSGLEDAMKSGADFQMPSITSTTINPYTATSFSGHSEGDKKAIVFKIKAKSGMYVDHLSANQGEYELMQSAKTKYKVSKIAPVKYDSGSGAKTHETVYLEEV